MNIKIKTVISIVAATVLLTACGGGGDGGGTVVVPDTTPKPTIKNAVTSFKVLKGQKKLVTMSTGKNVIDAGEPVNLFEIVDNGGAIGTHFDEAKANSKNYGLLTFIAPATVGKYNVIVKSTNASGTSADTTFTFDVVDKSDVPSVSSVPVKVLPTTGRTFTESRLNVVDDDTGLTWRDDSNVDLKSRTQSSAAEKCTGDWRLPTTNELLDLVDYAKPVGTSMVPSKFNTAEHAFDFAWAEAVGGKSYYVVLKEGMTYIDTAGQPLPYRCVKGNKYETNHFISTDFASGLTYDFSTGLSWSKAVQVTSESEAGTRCSGTILGKSGWRVPTINELRSIVEDGSVPGSIVFKSDGEGQYLTLFSSTPSNDADHPAGSADGTLNYSLQLNWDRSAPLVKRAYTSKEGVDYAVSCVRNFEDSDVTELLQ